MRHSPVPTVSAALLACSAVLADGPAASPGLDAAPADEPFGAAYTWHDALDACDRKGLRLPTAEQAAALFCGAGTAQEGGSTTVPAHHRCRDEAQGLRARGRYWTSSRHNAGVARYLDPVDGRVGLLGTGELLRVRCVSPRGRGPTAHGIADIDRDSFEAITDSVFGLYERELADSGRTVVVNRRWELDEVSALSWISERYDAAAGRVRSVVEIELPGGLARHPMLTADAYALVVCHELGHHLGGAPHSNGYSAEGQADYFAAAKCMKRYLRTVPEGPPGGSLTDTLEAACTATYRDQGERMRCRRNILAGLTLSRWIAHAEGAPPTWPDRRDPAERKTTLLRGYPGPQCRLDTFIAGALCPVDADTAFSFDDVRAGACLRAGRHSRAARPACWFSATPP